MALDTRNKRASALGIALVSLIALPAPDGAALDQGDRQHVTACYRGINASTVVTPTFTTVTLRRYARVDSHQYLARPDTSFTLWASLGDDGGGVLSAYTDPASAVVYWALGTSILDSTTRLS